MRVSAIRSLLCLAAAATVATAAHGQDSIPIRDGFWFSGGLGVGSLGCDGCSGRTNGLSGGLVFGGTLGENFLVGGGTTGWTKTENGATLSVGTLDVRIRFYASPRSGLYFTVGGGIGSISAAVAGLGSGSEIGAGLLIGGGFDIRVAGMVSLTPYAHLFTVKTENISSNVGQIGLAITLH